MSAEIFHTTPYILQASNVSSDYSVFTANATMYSVTGAVSDKIFLAKVGAYTVNGKVEDLISVYQTRAFVVGGATSFLPIICVPTTTVYEIMGGRNLPHPRPHMQTFCAYAINK